MTAVSAMIEGDGPLLVFGGPYGNLQATDAVLAAAAERGLPPSRIVCTGDLVAYCGDPVTTIARIREAGIHVVMGNCDEQLAAGSDDCGCGFPEGGACDRLSSAWFGCVDREVGARDRAWLAALPRSLDARIGGRRLRVVHGGVDVINRFIFATSPLDEKRRQLALAAADGCHGIVGGHCGMPFTQIIDGRLWHNAGVAGMPANDGTPRGWYSVLTPGRSAIEITHHAFDYDHRAAMEAMARGGYPAEYRAALESGTWPSCDVLTAHERTIQGVALVPGTVRWMASERRPGMSAAWPQWPVPLTAGEAAASAACC
ncbi:MAG: metallophosphoesterase family protein [Phycisphaerae bacterium]|nr:metallophosphoesterase family protein [Phycisphaerae bacterium]